MKCWPIASGVVTDNSPVGLTSGPAAPPLEFEDRLGHGGSQCDHFFASDRGFVSRARALEQARANRRLQRSEAPKHRRMIDAETLGRPDQRMGFRDRLDQSKLVPA